ERQYSELEE
nr:alpha protein, ClpB=peptide 11 [Escherichia coli, Peptide Partial, 9 aa] [Escherichia coli]